MQRVVTAELFRMAGDPLGVAFDVMVVCPECGGFATERWFCGGNEVDVICDICNGKATIPNPAITQECGTCGGRGERTIVRNENPRYPNKTRPCRSCEGRGWTFRSSVRVAERVRVELWPAHSVPVPRVAVDPITKRVDWTDGWKVQDITHLWEQPCPECGGAPLGRHLRVRKYEVSIVDSTCGTCDGKGTVVVPPEPGSVWEIGWREAELGIVIPDLGEVISDRRGVWPRFLLRPSGRVLMWQSWTSEGHDITHHFSTPPKPGQRAAVLGDLVLADKARKVEP